MTIRLFNRGDTIVEVLIAISVVSIILGGAYVTSSRSLGNIRGAQERIEALKLIEGQLERLSVIAQTDDGSTNVFTTRTNIFCIDPNSAVINATTSTRGFGSMTPTSPNSLDKDNFSTYASDCNGGAGVQYHLAIDRQDDPGDTSGAVFIGYARWDRVNGGGRDELTVRYRLNKR